MADTTDKTDIHCHSHPDAPKSPHNQFTDVSTSLTHTFSQAYPHRDTWQSPSCHPLPLPRHHSDLLSICYVPGSVRHFIRIISFNFLHFSMR